MRIEQMRLSVIDIPFKTAFTHAGATRSKTAGILVEVRSRRGAIGHGEGCPRIYVTGETVDTAREFFEMHRSDVMQEVRDIASLRDWVCEKRGDIDANPAAWCAMELALLDTIARERGRPVEAILGLPPVSGEYHYSAVIGDDSRGAFACQFRRYRRMGFTDFKLKTSGRRDRDGCKVEALRGEGGVGLRVRLDANNTWRRAHEAVAYLRTFDYPVFAVEEPLAPGAYRELEQIGRTLDTRIILDESLTRLSQLPELLHRPETWIINLRVSKMGGLLRSMELVRRARDLEIPLIIGAHVGETSLLARAALTVARAAGPALLAQEGAFGTYLLAHDVCQSPIMFGPGGRLSTDECLVPGAPGFGLAIRTERTSPREAAA